MFRKSCQTNRKILLIFFFRYFLVPVTTVRAQFWPFFKHILRTETMPKSMASAGSTSLAVESHQVWGLSHSWWDEWLIYHILGGINDWFITFLVGSMTDLSHSWWDKRITWWGFHNLDGWLDNLLQCWWEQEMIPSHILVTNQNVLFSIYPISTLHCYHGGFWLALTLSREPLLFTLSCEPIPSSHPGVSQFYWPKGEKFPQTWDCVVMTTIVSD